MTATDTLVIAFVMVLSISAVFMLGQIAIKEINPASNATFYNCENGLLSAAMRGGACSAETNYSLDTNVSDRFASQSTAISPTTGDIFTDTFSAAKNWLFDKLGLSYVVAFLAAPFSILEAIGAPTALAAAFAAVFYLVVFFLLVSWALGR